jgi:hypothetical protein
MIQQSHKMKAEQALVRQWYLFYRYHDANSYDTNDLKEEIWKYIEDNKIELYRECEFETIISNAPRSTTELAHYFPNGDYYDSVDELGDDPIEVRLPFEITREMFDIDLSMLYSMEESNFEFEWITELFEPKADWLTPF